MPTPPHTVDFETEKIAPRPAYPPKPVGVAILEVGRRAEYLAWGHPTGNNCTKRDALRRLRALWRSNRPILFHNGKFDEEVGYEHLGLPLLPWDRMHDTEFLAFLNDPYERTLSLKPLADKYLDMPPEEQDRLRDWILEHVPEAKPSNFGAYIARAPGTIVAPYAKGDVVRTRKLWNLFYPHILEQGMGEAYDRERQLMPRLLMNERRGVPVDRRELDRLERDLDTSVSRADQWLRKRLKTPDLDVDSNQSFADALERSGAVESFILTDKGNRSVSKDNLTAVIKDTQILNAFLYRTKAAYSLRTFVRPWNVMAHSMNGTIHTNWHQVRSSDDRGRKSSGARTGRLSSSPNFQNVTNTPEQLKLVRALRDVIPLPALRGIIIPGRGYVLFGRDYSQQEIRVLAHFEDGALLHAYLANPRLDVHSHAQTRMLEEFNLQVGRKPIKTMGFGLIYGMGIGLLAAKMGMDVQMSRTVKQAYLRLFPDLKELDRELKRIGRSGEMIRTWGGRLYPVEPPANGRTFEYKLLNYLIQGSSADNTKQAMINYEEVKHEDAQLLLTVHDELLCRAPTRLWKPEMKKLNEAMLDVDFDVPMLSDGKMSRTSWATMQAVA